MSQELVPPKRGRPSLVHAAARREAFIRHALRRFSEIGYRQTTMEGLAATFGMSKTTLYRQYGSKSGLLLAAVNSAAPSFSEALSQVASMSARPPEEVLYDFGCVIRAEQMSPDRRALYLALGEAQNELRAFPHLVSDRATAALAPVAAYLDLLKGRGLIEIEDTTRAATCFSAMISGGLGTFLGDPIENPELLPPIEFCVRIFLHGLMKK